MNARKLTIITLASVLVIALIGFALRLTPFFKYAHYGIWLQYDDSMFEYWLSKYLHAHGLGSWYDLTPKVTKKWWWWPQGRDIRSTEYPGLAFVGAGGYPLAKALGLRLVDWVGIEPALFGFLAILSATALGWVLVGAPLATTFTVALSFQHAFMNRSIASFVEKMSPALFFGTLALTAFTLILKEREFERAQLFANRKALGLAIGAGLALMLGFAFWGGEVMFLGIMFLTVVLLPLFINSSERYLALAVWMLVTYLVLVISSLWITTVWLNPLHKFIIASGVMTVVVLLIEYYLSKRMKDFARTWTLAVVVITIAIVTFSTLFVDTIGKLLPYRYLIMLMPWLKKVSSPLERSIAEHQGILNTYPAPALTSLIGVGLMAPLLVYFIVKLAKERKDERAIALLPTAVASIFAIYLLVTNTSVYLTTPIGYLSALGGAAVLALAIENVFKTKNAFEKLFMASISVIGIMLLLASSASGIRFAINYPPPSFLSAGTGLYTPLFPDAMKVVKENCKFAVAWWDYGYMLTTVGNATTVVDPATINGTKIALVAKALTRTENVTAKILREFLLPPNETCVFAYEIFPANLRDKVVFLLPQAGDFAKSIWMFRISGLKDTEIFKKYIKIVVRLLVVLPNGKRAIIVSEGMPKITPLPQGGALVTLPNGQVIKVTAILNVMQVPLYNVKDVFLYSIIYEGLKKSGFRVYDALERPINVVITFKHFKLVKAVMDKLYIPNTDKPINGLIGVAVIYRYVG